MQFGKERMVLISLYVSIRKFNSSVNGNWEDIPIINPQIQLFPGMTPSTCTQIEECVVVFPIKISPNVERKSNPQNRENKTDSSSPSHSPVSIINRSDMEFLIILSNSSVD